jgi:hypothetical protein
MLNYQRVQHVGGWLSPFFATSPVLWSWQGRVCLKMGGFHPPNIIQTMAKTMVFAKGYHGGTLVWWIPRKIQQTYSFEQLHTWTVSTSKLHMENQPIMSHHVPRVPWHFSISTVRGFFYIHGWWLTSFPWKIWARQIGSSSQLLGKIKFMFQTTGQYIVQWVYPLLIPIIQWGESIPMKTVGFSQAFLQPELSFLLNRLAEVPSWGSDNMTKHHEVMIPLL